MGDYDDAIAQRGLAALAREGVWRALRSTDLPMSAQEIADVVRPTLPIDERYGRPILSYSDVYPLLCRMERNGLVIRIVVDDSHRRVFWQARG